MYEGSSSRFPDYVSSMQFWEAVNPRSGEKTFWQDQEPGTPSRPMGGTEQSEEDQGITRMSSMVSRTSDPAD